MRDQVRYTYFSRSQWKLTYGEMLGNKDKTKFAFHCKIIFTKSKLLLPEEPGVRYPISKLARSS